MRFSSIVAVLAGFGVVFYVNFAEGDPVGALLNLEAAVIVIVGCLVAVLGQFHLDGLLRSARKLAWLVRPPLDDMKQFVEDASEWCRTARRDGLLKLEDEIESIDDDFLRDGLQLIIDGVEAESVRSLMKSRIEREETDDYEPFEMCDALGGYAPTLGVLGAVMGLIHVMLHLGDGGKSIGIGIAAAFVATMYGVALANLIFIPMGKRLEKIAENRARNREIKLAALVMLAEGKNPNTLRTQIMAYLGQTDEGNSEQQYDDAA